MRRIVILGGAFVLIAGLRGMVAPAAADVFGTGANEFEIKFVRIGSPGNPPDANPNPAGAVPYVYRIGRFEISEQMIDKANAEGALGLTIDMRGPNMPATSVTWYEAAHFVNWLNTSNGFTPAYKFDGTGTFQLWEPTDPGYDANNLYRNRRARYFLPSVNEWHKAAYYDPVTDVYYDYPTGSDSVPDGIDFVGDPNFDAVFYDGGSNGSPNLITNVGLVSPFRTAGQGGNVREWVETAFDRVNSIASEQRSTPGGSLNDHPNLLAAWNTGIGIGPLFQGGFLGLRVASSIPEPCTIVTFVIGLVALLRERKRGHSTFSGMCGVCRAGGGTIPGPVARRLAGSIVRRRKNSGKGGRNRFQGIYTKTVPGTFSTSRGMATVSGGRRVDGARHEQSRTNAGG